MRKQAVEQIEAILKGLTTIEDIAEIEKVVAEAKGVIQCEMGDGFWEGKTPCWEICHCPEVIRSECAAPKYRSVPCWEIEGTYCKLGGREAGGTDTNICEVCRVYKKWGQNKPIVITLFGEGIGASARTEELVREESAKV